MPFQKGQGGRKKGVKNKAIRDIRAFLQETVDWTQRRDNLIKLANEGNVKAEEMLWQYGHGKPVEVQIAPIQIKQDSEDAIKHEHKHSLDAESTRALRDLAKFVTGRPAGT